MTQEELCPPLEEQLNSSSGSNSEDADIVVRPDRASVKDMILRFERTALNNLGASSESLERIKDLGNFSVLNPIHYLSPGTRSQDRNSIASVNSILSNASEISFESNSSGFVSDRKSEVPKPHRPAPPPPAPFNDSSSSESKSPVPEETPLVERKYSYTTPSASPVVMRRTRHPPVIRKKSGVGSQGHLGGETLWSYGVRQSDLEKLLRLKRSELSDNEEEQPKYNDRSEPSGTESGSDDSNENETSDGNEYIVNVDNGRIDTLSADHSTDTLINEEYSGDEGDGDDLSVASCEPCNYDNVSIKSISSLELVSHQKYDSITVSSDEFGSEVCHAPDTEFLTVSAVNEWCVSKSIQPVLIAVETKNEKYRR